MIIEWNIDMFDLETVKEVEETIYDSEEWNLYPTFVPSMKNRIIIDEHDLGDFILLCNNLYTFMGPILDIIYDDCKERIKEYTSSIKMFDDYFAVYQYFTEQDCYERIRY